MREIIFRGKRLDNGEWVEGDLIASKFISPDRNGELYINGKYVDGMVWGEGCFYSIGLSTVGQYTGLKDKHGKKIFEGDILLLDDIKGIVNYGTGCFCVKLPSPDYLYRNNPAIDMVLNEYPGLEIIGNAHDNPELIYKE